MTQRGEDVRGRGGEKGPYVPDRLAEARRAAHTPPMDELRGLSGVALERVGAAAALGEAEHCCEARLALALRHREERERERERGGHESEIVRDCTRVNAKGSSERLKRP